MAMHRSLSSRTVYQRFFAVQPELSAPQADYFTCVDGRDRFALVAQDDDGGLVAVGRYDRLPPDGASAEVAVVVADAHQQHGLGTVLLRLLRAHAAEAGVVDFVADVLAENSAIRHAFALAGLEAQAASYDSGVAHLLMPLAETAGRRRG
jgi:RimJ/RimL family protein N-acetyltransferase